jgi:hypothetical protein
MLRELSSKQISEWMAFYNLEPWGWEEEWFRFAKLMSLVANMFWGRTLLPRSPPTSSPVGRGRPRPRSPTRSSRGLTWDTSSVRTRPPTTRSRRGRRGGGSVSLEQVIANLNAEVARIESTSESNMIKAMILIKRASLKRTPVKHGNLRRSCDTRVYVEGKRIVGEIKYGADYAVYVHEMGYERRTTVSVSSGMFGSEGGNEASWLDMEGEEEVQTRTIHWTKKGTGAKFLERALKENTAAIFMTLAGG